jgi:hypothetical protein
MAIAVLIPTVQFFDNSGNPLNGGTVTVQNAGTTTSRNIYTDTGLSVAATNPIPLDSAGRPTQGMIYTAASAYKIIVKNSAGTTLYTRDNIDPGVPIGSGTLAIANGGTGAATAGAAIAALGGATAAEVTTLSSSVASNTARIGTTDSTEVAKGTTAQRPGSPVTGDVRWNTTTAKLEAYDGSDWRDIFHSGDTATQANMETATSTTTVVTPGRAQYHPGVAKAWGVVSESGGTLTLSASHNVTSITDGGAGICTFNLTTAFSSANYVVVAMPFVWAGARVWSYECSARATTSFTIKSYTTTASGDSDKSISDNSFMVVAFGDQ